MLNGISHDGTGDMEGAKEGLGRGINGVWFRKPNRDCGTIPLGNPTGTSGDG